MAIDIIIIVQFIILTIFVVRERIIVRHIINKSNEMNHEKIMLLADRMVEELAKRPVIKGPNGVVVEPDKEELNNITNCMSCTTAIDCDMCRGVK